MANAIEQTELIGDVDDLAVARILYTDLVKSLHVLDEVVDEQWAEIMADPSRRGYWRARAHAVIDAITSGVLEPVEVKHPDRLWSLIDWSLWGWGVGDVLRERAANQFIAALSAADAQHIRTLVVEWEKTHGHPGRKLYDAVKAARATLASRLAEVQPASAECLCKGGDADALRLAIRELDDALEATPVRPEPVR